MKALIAFDLDGTLAPSKSAIEPETSALLMKLLNQLYADDLSKEQQQQIIDALKTAVAASGFQAAKTWGETIENRYDRSYRLGRRALEGVTH